MPHAENDCPRVTEAIKNAVKDIEDVARAHHGDTHESVQLARDIEILVKEIERKSLLRDQSAQVAAYQRPVRAV